MNAYETEKDNAIFQTANIIIAGVTGAGKSTLINAVFGKDFAATGKGHPVTQEIREYRSPELPVRIWDSIGFEIGNNNSGVSKTKAAITEIKKTIEEQVAKNEIDHIHAIWYCINQGGSRYQQTEADFVKELHSIGVPFIIIITQCVDEDDNFAKEVNRLNIENGITDIPVIEVLAQDKKFRGGGCIPSFGLETLVQKTLEMLPSYIKGSFIAGQQIKVVLKREECEDIITKYVELAEKGFWDGVPIANMLTANKKFKYMIKEIFSVYNQILPEDAYEKLVFDLSKEWSKELFGWCCLPPVISKKQNKLNEIINEINEKGSEGLELTNGVKDSKMAAKAIACYGYTSLLVIEEVWTMIREDKIKNLEEVVIPLIKDKINKYLSGKRAGNKSDNCLSINGRA